MNEPNLRPGHRALRRGRISIPNQVYHLTLSTHNRVAFFADWPLGRVVARALNDSALLGDSSTLAWALMPDHLHWLLALGEAGLLPKVVQRVKSRTAIEVNRQLGRSGPLWEHAYHDHALRQEEDLRTAARYIVANPLKAGLVEDIGKYPLWDAIWLHDP